MVFYERKIRTYVLIYLIRSEEKYHLKKRGTLNYTIHREYLDSESWHTYEGTIERGIVVDLTVDWDRDGTSSTVRISYYDVSYLSWN